MKLLIVRHGDPDYQRDSLTPKGWREARLLWQRLSALPIDYFYVSPLGRAQDTASCTLDLVSATATTCDWLREFMPPLVQRPDRAPGEKICAWDWLPGDWLARPHLMDREHWFQEPCFLEAGVGDAYHKVTRSLDSLLKDHGYEREGLYYRAVRPNHETLCFFCHFGVEGVLLSHLLNISPMQLWQGCVAAPSSVTTLATEERREGIAVFRMSGFGDISHLYAGQEPPSKAARFCECFSDLQDRHD